MKTALYCGSFDPITLGHVDIAERSAALFDQVTFAIFDKPLKHLTFTPEQRFQLAVESLAHLENVNVTLYHGLTTQYATEIGANALIRGIRTVNDYDKEMQYALANRHLAPDIDTVCFFTNQDFAFVSSSLIKEIAMNGGEVSHLVSQPVLAALKDVYGL
ncbi:MAG: pantetheine-phosphate adenylyltransferase [Chloroflexota bacterium]